jgi:hypothetical protein
MAHALVEMPEDGGVGSPAVGAISRLGQWLCCGGGEHCRDHEGWCWMSRYWGKQAGWGQGSVPGAKKGGVGCLAGAAIKHGGPKAAAAVVKGAAVSGSVQSCVPQLWQTR